MSISCSKKPSFSHQTCSIMTTTGSITFQNGTIFSSIVKLLAASLPGDSRLILEPNSSVSLTVRNPTTRSIFYAVFNQGIWLPAITTSSPINHFAIDPVALLPAAASVGEQLQM
jgi:hypothetical protein